MKNEKVVGGVKMVNNIQETLKMRKRVSWEHKTARGDRQWKFTHSSILATRSRFAPSRLSARGKRNERGWRWWERTKLMGNQLSAGCFLEMKSEWSYMRSKRSRGRFGTRDEMRRVSLPTSMSHSDNVVGIEILKKVKFEIFSRNLWWKQGREGEIREII